VGKAATMSERVCTPPEKEQKPPGAASRWSLRGGKVPHFTADPETVRYWRKGVEWDRKGIHLTSTILALWTFYMHEPFATGGLILATVFVLVVDRGRLASRRWGLWMYRKFPFVFRSDERHDYSGASIMMIGATLTSALFPFRPATAGILCLTWGDSAAALVGQFYSHWRRMRKLKRVDGRIPPAVSRRRHKTVAGTLGCLIVSMLMILLVMFSEPITFEAGGTWPLWTIVVLGGVAAALMERWTPGRWDNLTMPLATAGVIHYVLTWLS
jgi:dolichol kinase